MQKNKLKILLITLNFIFVIGCLALPIMAKEHTTPLLQENDFEQIEEKIGSITIMLEDTTDSLSKQSVEISIVKVAKVTNQGYELMPLFEESGINLTEIETAEDLMEASILLKNLVPENAEVSLLRTDENGQCLFENLEVGVYLLYPKDTAEYENISPLLIAIPTFDVVEGQMQYDVTVYPKHSSNPSIRIRKVDSIDKTKVLKQAEFTLYDENMVELKVASTNENGIAEFYNVKNGIYWIKETKAPKGYKLAKDPIKVVIDEEYDGEQLFEVTVQNTLLPVIVQTGDHSDIWLYAGLCCIALAGLGLVLLKKKHESFDE